MSGGYLFGLILLSMAWLLSILLLAANFMAWRAALRAPPGARRPSGIPFLPGILASVTVFFTLPLAKTHAGIDVPWPFFWILLPFFLDMFGPGGVLLSLAGLHARRAQPGVDADGANAAVAAQEAQAALPPSAHEAAQALEARENAAVGCLLGTAVGDALGLPCEGLSRARLARWNPPLDRYWLLPGRGMCSDDTDHACMAAQAVVASGGHPRRFASSLAWRMRFWLVSLPAGVGFATLRAILKLWLFVPPPYSGVRSAGNGPAMRSALLGVLFADSDALLVMHCAASTSLTHTDRRAECGALAVALAARAAMRGSTPSAYLEELKRFCLPFGDAGASLVELVARAAQSAARGEDTAGFAASIGCGHGVSGYVLHSVPVALHAWFRHPGELPAALAAVIRCGGDTDTTGAIVGSIVGAGTGRDGIPARWLDTLWDWPRGPQWMERAARAAVRAAAQRQRGTTLYTSPWGMLARNAMFLGVVLAHGLRRLAPPW